ncbi:MAG: polyhydroxyalkanoate synthesis regulator DNA-binding domain-containing protein [Desulfobacteraceae bacterium]|nr:polyhydroxyalkanoate synthesis regulator DNA-binding domain-containing protein [Desulfobacteraceae bacterium]
MHRIKKYANRKLYDVTAKQYVTMDDIAELVQSGEDIRIIDNTSGEEITQEVVSQLVGRVFDGQARKLPLTVLVQLLRRGSGGVVDYTRKYLSFWQNALNFAEDELDKVDIFIGKDKSGAGGKSQIHQDKNLKDDGQEYVAMLKLLDERIDQRLDHTLRSKEVALQKQITKINSHVTKLTARIETFENIFSRVLEHEAEPTAKASTKGKTKPIKE